MIDFYLTTTGTLRMTDFYLTTTLLMTDFYLTTTLRASYWNTTND